jgi:hypothetical protein
MRLSLLRARQQEVEKLQQVLAQVQQQNGQLAEQLAERQGQARELKAKMQVNHAATGTCEIIAISTTPLLHSQKCSTFQLSQLQLLLLACLQGISAALAAMHHTTKAWANRVVEPVG